MTHTEAFTKLIGALSALPRVSAIGQSGSGSLPVANESDVDVFLYCDGIPTEAERAEALQPLGDLMANAEIGALHSVHWGEGDCLDLCGMEVWLMYFDRTSQESYLQEVRDGMHTDKVHNYFYPTGRLATLLTMKPLYDPCGMLADYRALLTDYPQALRRALLARHIPALSDTEDLLRAVSREDTLFFHFAMDLALDHFLQALFALNRSYFPSRKRSLMLAKSFALQPEHMAERLHAILRLGGDPATLADAFAVWQALAEELTSLARSSAE